MVVVVVTQLQFVTPMFARRVLCVDGWFQYGSFKNTQTTTWHYSFVKRGHSPCHPHHRVTRNLPYQGVTGNLQEPKKGKNIHQGRREGGKKAVQILFINF